MSARRTDRGGFDSDRFEELRALRALGTLTAAECQEFTALLAERANVDLESDELAVAALELANVEPELAPLPRTLAERLRVDAQAHFAARGAAAPTSSAPSVPAPATRATPRVAPIRELRPRAQWGWIVAAAAAVIAFIAWWPRFVGSPQVSPAAARDALLARGGAMTVPWQGTDFAKGAEGDVVWDQAAQRGFMRIRGLAKNDPAREQYQLWIFDETQKHPVDGGVFDVGADGELVIPIDAKLRVAKPTLFAVTVEKPGGVVVSAQEKIVLAGRI